MKLKMVLATTALAFGLAGCNNGINHALDTGHGQQAYRASLDEALKKMTKEETEAFDWAVGGLNIEKLHEKFPDSTPRKIIQGQAKNFIDAMTKARPDIEKMIPDFDAKTKVLSENTIVDSANFHIENDFFGLQPKVTAKIVNVEGRTMTALKWRVELFLDGNTTPAASTVIEDNYKGGGGFQPGYRYTRTFTLGFVKGDERFTTLEIQNAKKREVKLTLIPDGCVELDGKSVSSMDPHAALKELDEILAKAKKYQSI